MCRGDAFSVPFILSCPKVTKMGSIFGHRIDYNEPGLIMARGSERPSARTQQKLTQVPRPGIFLGHPITGTSEKRVSGPGSPQPSPQGAFPSKARQRGPGDEVGVSPS